MIATALGLCLSVVTVTPQDPPLLNGNQGRVLMTYSLRNLVGVAPAPTVPPVWSFLEMGEDGQSGVSLISVPENPRQIASPEVIADLLRTMHREVTDNDVLLEIMNETLFLSGDTQEVNQVLASLRRLERNVARVIEIKASLYEWPEGDLPSGVVTADWLEDLALGGRRPLWSGTAAARSGVVAELGQAQWTSYMADAQVEVAQKSWISDPVVRLLFEGVLLMVQPHALVGGEDLALFCQYAVGRQRGPMGIRYTGQKEFPALDVPDVDLDAGLASGRVPNGGALVCSFRSHEDSGSQMILVVSASQPATSAEQTSGLRSLPISALVSATRGNQSARTRVNGKLPPDSDIFGGIEFRGAERIIELGALMDVIRSNVNPDAWGDTAFMDSSMGFLHIGGDAATVERAEELVLQLQERWVRNTDVEFQTSLEPAAHAFGPLVEVTGVGDPRELHRVVQPALTGRTVLNLHGTETLSIREMNVEIAQSSAAADPIVDSVFSGIYGSVLPYATPGGLGVRTEIDLAYTKELEARATRNKDGGDLYLPSTGIARFAHSGPIESGQFMDMGTGPVVTIDNLTYRTRQRMRVTLR